MATTVGEILIPLEVETKGLKKGEKAIDGLGKSLRSLAKPAAIAATALAAIGVSALKAAADLEKSLREVNTLLGRTAKGFAEIQKDVIALSSDLGQSANDLASALYQAVSAGNDYGDALKVVEQSSKLAVAGVADLTDTVNLVTTVLNAWKLEASELEEVSDSLFTAVRLGKTTVSELASAIGQIAPTAFNAGVSLDEINGGLALLTANGLSTAEAVTGLRAILSGVIKPGKEAADAAKELGVDFSVAAIQSKGLARFLGEIGEATDGSITALAEFFPNVRAIGPALTLAAKGGQEYIDVLDEFNEKNGATQEGFEELERSTTRQTKRLVNELKNLQIQLGQNLQPVFNNFLNGVRILGRAIEILTDRSQDLTERLNTLWIRTKALFGATKDLNEELEKQASNRRDTGLRILALDLDTTREEVVDLIREYEKLNNLPPFSVTTDTATKEFEDLRKQFAQLAELRERFGEEDATFLSLKNQIAERQKEIAAQKESDKLEAQKLQKILQINDEVKRLQDELDKQNDLPIWDERLNKAKELLVTAKQIGDAGLIDKAQLAVEAAQRAKNAKLAEKQAKEERKASEARKKAFIERAKLRAKEAKEEREEREKRIQGVKDFLAEFERSQESPAVQSLLNDFEEIQKLIGDALPEDVKKLENAFASLAEQSGKAFENQLEAIGDRINQIENDIKNTTGRALAAGQDYESRRQAIVNDDSLNRRQKKEALEQVNVEFKAERDKLQKLEKFGVIDSATAQEADKLTQFGLSADEAIELVEQTRKLEELRQQQELIAKEQKVFEQKKQELLNTIAKNTAKTSPEGQPEEVKLAPPTQQEADNLLFGAAPPGDDALDIDGIGIQDLSEPEVDVELFDGANEALNGFGDSADGLLSQVTRLGDNIVNKFTEVDENLVTVKEFLEDINQYFAPGGNGGIGAI